MEFRYLPIEGTWFIKFGDSVKDNVCLFPGKRTRSLRTILQHQTLLELATASNYIIRDINSLKNAILLINSCIRTHLARRYFAIKYV